MRFLPHFALSKCKIVGAGDSSLGNNSKYSQGGHSIFLAHDVPDVVCGSFIGLSFKSSKSKPVAGSTMHAETLAMTQMTEEIAFIQTWMYELLHPEISVNQLLDISPKVLMPSDVCADCNDFHIVVMKPTILLCFESCSNAIYCSTLRG